MTAGKSISKKDKLIYICGLASIILLTIALIITGKSKSFYHTQEERRAFDYMKSAIEIVSEQNNLIGPEISDITTTLGDRAAKRTSLHPAMAPLIVRLLRSAGVKSGDTVALGCSGSFPGLLIASLSAAQAMGIEPVVILSLGSSSFGASDPEFTIFDLNLMLFEKGFTSHLPTAVSLGGDMDVGTEFDKEMKSILIEKIKGRGISLIYEENLEANRAMRDSIYFGGTSDRIKAFINSGGGYASMGTSSLSLLLKPGLVRRAQMPDPDSRGVIHDMIEKDIPVIHLLHIKGLAQRYHIPWDIE
jgi:poly-gamma-glutamate system protein